MAMHIVGSHGAGQHRTDYYNAKDLHIPDDGELSDEELRDYILSSISDRHSRGVTKHYSTSFMPVARQSDIIYCLDSLVEQGVLCVNREYECENCGNTTGSRPIDLSASCCQKSRYRMIKEFYSS